jgi:hypothetical protein
MLVPVGVNSGMAVSLAAGVLGTVGAGAGLGLQAVTSAAHSNAPRSDTKEILCTLNLVSVGDVRLPANALIGSTGGKLSAHCANEVDQDLFAAQFGENVLELWGVVANDDHLAALQHLVHRVGH